jgi:hypothetical protein
LKLKDKSGNEVWINSDVISHVERHIDYIPKDLQYSGLLEVKYTRINLISGGWIIAPFEAYQDITDLLGD